MVPADARIPDGRVFEAFFDLYYHSATDIPREICTQLKLSDPKLHERWLREKSGSTVTIVSPKRGDKKRLIELARKNAWLKITAETRDSAKGRVVLGEVKEALGLPATPFRIEAYDISNIQGSDAVGAMVTFENGVKFKSGYRHFKIRSIEGIDDVAMIEEVLTRRMGAIAEGKEKRPDLILIDGGAGQVTAARRGVENAGVTGIPIFGLAKKNEELYREGSGETLRLPRRSPALRFLQRVRDEVHRFAVDYHRKLRSKRISRSMLDDVPGIGEKRKILILSAFGSLDAVMRASKEEIEAVPGIGGKLAEEIYNHLHR
jgi:excinuclease ABC subunit C